MFRKWLNERIFNCRFGVRNALDSLAEDIFSILNAILCRIVFRDEFQMQTIAFDREIRFYSFFFFTRHNCTLRKEFDFVLEIFAHFFFSFQFLVMCAIKWWKIERRMREKNCISLVSSIRQLHPRNRQDGTCAFKSFKPLLGYCCGCCC